LRAAFLKFSIALVVFGVVLAALGPGSAPAPTAIFTVIVVALGALSLVLPRFIEKPLDCSSNAKLAASYRTRFFLRVALSEGVALWGFVGAINTGKLWLYALGLAFTAIGFLRLAPTAANLAREEQNLAVGGCPCSLIAALTQVEGTS
jgi:hypothetical protein